MATIQYLIDIFLHIDKHLSVFMHSYGAIAYILMFLCIFCETGLVVTPFLPGDSLIFAAGALAVKNIVSPWTIFLFCAAAVLGNMCNYQIGRALGKRVEDGHIRFIKKEYIEKTQHFFQKYGAVTIIITRFMPIIRTFAPFVAGVGEMPYRKFLLYNLFGGVIWASFFFGVGYFFGNLPFFKEHFSMVVVLIVCVSLLPAVIGFLKTRFGKKVKDAA